MDTTKEYILMCEKVPDEMKQEFHGQTDWYVYVKSGLSEDVFIFSEIAPSLEMLRKPVSVFPIFRQDQLQEMVKRNNAYCLTADFLKWMDELDNKGYPENEELLRMRFSMEQLWLAFVMKEKYQKTWDGKEWINN